MFEIKSGKRGLSWSLQEITRILFTDLWMKRGVNMIERELLYGD